MFSPCRVLYGKNDSLKFKDKWISRMRLCLEALQCGAAERVAYLPMATEAPRPPRPHEVIAAMNGAGRLTLQPNHYVTTCKTDMRDFLLAESLAGLGWAGQRAGAGRMVLNGERARAGRPTNQFVANTGARKSCTIWAKWHQPEQNSLI